MSQQNIDFGTFPDDPSADAIRTAFQKVQNNFNEVYAGLTNSSVNSINRSPGAGITVNSPSGNVVVTANISSVTVSSPNLTFGTSLSVLSSSAVYTSATQTLYVVVPNTFSIGNMVLSGNANISGNLSIAGNASLGNVASANYFVGSGNNLSNIQGANISGTVALSTTAGTVTTNAQPNITSIGTLISLSVSGNANIGNIGTAGLITATGDVSGANIISTGYQIRSVDTAISAAGTVQSDATGLTKEFNIVSTVSTGSGVVLPLAIAGMSITITNTDANALLVYPASGAQINSLGTDASFSQGTATIQFIAPTTTQWYTVGAA
jgi:hypothetical protein